MTAIPVKKQERKTVIWIGLSFLLFLIINFHPFHHFSFYDRSYFLVSHTLLEFFSIFVSFSIFMQAWLTYSHDQKRSHFLLGMVFLCVGAFDLIHTFAFKGMPFFDEKYAVARATWLWIAARTTESIGLTFILYKDFGRVGFLRFPKQLLLAACFYMVAVFFVIFNFTTDLPMLLKEGKGVTPLKLGIEYVISLLHFANALLLWRFYKKSKSGDLLVVMVGVCFIMIGELTFTLYTKVDDIENLVGHVYKFFGYFFLLRGIFYPHFYQVYEEKEDVQIKWKQTEEKLKESEKKMTTLVMRAQEEERKRVSRELHDGVGQALYSIIVKVKMTKRTIEDQQMIEVLQDMESMVGQAMKEVKELATQLRPSALDDLGLIPALRSYITRCREIYGIQMMLRVEGVQGRFSPEIETALYRICQEALTNAVKYSGTDAIDIILTHTDDYIQLTVQDYGQGFDMSHVLTEDKGGIGLFSMQERATLLQGEVIIRSEQGRGTSVNTYIPVRENTYSSTLEGEVAGFN